MSSLKYDSKFKCDLCLKKDGFHNFNLQKCIECGVCFHEECYGLPPTQNGRKNDTFVCLACDAVGKDIPVRRSASKSHRGDKNNYYTIKQRERPTECALCSVNDGCHAMHPLFDRPGKRGKQLVLPADEKRGLPERLAWIHSLCGYIIGNREGFVYACNSRGGYDADEDDGVFVESDSESDEGSESESNSSEDCDGAVHHFVLCGKVRGHHTRWSWAMHKLRKEVTCSICNMSDKGKGNLRLPIQCTAGREDEFDEYKERHEEIEHPCTVGVHVGCAMWHKLSKFRRAFFYPGKYADDDEEGFNEPVMECYCNAHAKDVGVKVTPHNIDASIPPKDKSIAPQTIIGLKQTTTHGVHNSCSSSNKKRQLGPQQTVQQRPPKKLKLRQSSAPPTLMHNRTSSKFQIIADDALPVRTTSVKRLSSLSTGTTLKKRQPFGPLGDVNTTRTSTEPTKKSNITVSPLCTSRSTEASDAIEPTVLHVPLNDATTQSTGQNSEETDSQRDHQQQVVTNRDWFSEVFDDVIHQLRNAKNNGLDLVDVSSTCRKGWKKKHKSAGLGKAEWARLWGEVRTACNNALALDEIKAKEAIDSQQAAGEDHVESPSKTKATTTVGRAPLVTMPELDVAEEFSATEKSKKDVVVSDDRNSNENQVQKVPSSSDPFKNWEAALGGLRVAKKFYVQEIGCNEIFRGTLTRVLKGQQRDDDWFRIRYDDGDSEDFDIDGLYGALVLYGRVGEKKNALSFEEDDDEEQNKNKENAKASAELMETIRKLTNKAEASKKKRQEATPSNIRPGASVVDSPRKHDVVLRRGRHSANDPEGTVQWRNTVAKRREECHNIGTPGEKTNCTIAKQIVQEIRSQGGRFLRRNTSTGMYFEATDKFAEEATMKSLEKKQQNNEVGALEEEDGKGGKIVDPETEDIIESQGTEDATIGAGPHHSKEIDVDTPEPHHSSETKDGATLAPYDDDSSETKDRATIASDNDEAEPVENRWKHLFIQDAGINDFAEFEFGEWDSFRIAKAL